MLSAFNPEEFMVEPSESTFQQLRKDDLILLGQHLKLEIRSSMRKCEIQTLVMDYIVNTTETFEQCALATYNTTSSKLSSADSSSVRRALHYSQQGVLNH